MRSFFNILSHLIPSKLIVSSFGTNVVLPFYHQVSDNQPAHTKHLYRALTIKEFTNDLDYLLKFFQPLDADSLLKLSTGGLRLSKPAFFLSFDDGFREAKDTIAPILISKGIPATFFVNPAYIGNNDMMYRCKISLIIEKIKTTRISNIVELEIAKSIGSKAETSSIVDSLLKIRYNQLGLINHIASILSIDFIAYQKEIKPYLSLEDLKELKALSFTIGGHGYNHPYFYQISFDEQKFEAESSMQWIKNNFHNQLSLFAFPFSDYGVSSELIRYLLLQQEKGVDLSFGTSGIQPRKYNKHYQRLPMEIKNISGKHIVGSEILYYLAKNTLGYYKKYDKNL